MGLRELIWEGRGGPFPLLLGNRGFPPTHTSRGVAAGAVVTPGATVIAVGCGSGVLSIVAARLGAGAVYGTDLNQESVAFARLNAVRLGLADRVGTRLGRLFEPLSGVRANVVIGDVSGIPDEIATESDWFPGGFSGGPTGAEVPVAMLASARDHMLPGAAFYPLTA